MPDNEFDAFLTGTYDEWLLHNRKSVPAWAWVNPVAHATAAQLEYLASHGSHWGAPLDVAIWRHACAFLASEVLASTGDDGGLASLQQRILVPLELRLAANWWSPLTPTELTKLVLAALQQAHLTDERDGTDREP